MLGLWNDDSFRLRLLLSKRGITVGMTDPTDRELLEFVARFAGWTELKWSDPDWVCGFHAETNRISVLPNYLHSVDAWLRDVVPVMEKQKKLKESWYMHLLGLCIGTSWYTANADARSRCLALWLAWEEKLP